MIYAMNKRTKEHRVVPRLDFLSSADWRYYVADADGWIEWRGGECPLPAYQDFELFDKGGDTFSGKEPVRHSWQHIQSEYDITHYRPILNKEQHMTTTAHEWRGEQDGLPPVGTVCECSLDFSEEKSSSNWNKIEVLYSDESTVVGRIIEGCHAPNFSNGFETNMYDFRPIRTDRERWIDDAMSMSDCPDNAPLIRQYFEAIHDALRNGDLTMPEVK